MMWAPEYNPYDLATFRGRTGKRLFPCRNILYASTITPAGLYSDCYFMKAPAYEANRAKNIDLTRKIEALRSHTGRTTPASPSVRQPNSLQLSAAQFFGSPAAPPENSPMRREYYLNRHRPLAQLGRGSSFTPVPSYASPSPGSGKFVLDSARPYFKRGV